MRSDDFKWVAQAIAINRETGGNLAEMLDQVGRTIRERNQIRRQVQALSAEGRLSGIILILLPIVVFFAFSFIQPDYFALFFTNVLGIIALVVAVILLIVGSCGCCSRESEVLMRTLADHRLLGIAVDGRSESACSSFLLVPGGARPPTGGAVGGTGAVRSSSDRPAVARHRRARRGYPGWIERQIVLAGRHGWTVGKRHQVEDRPRGRSAVVRDLLIVAGDPHPTRRSVLAMAARSADSPARRALNSRADDRQQAIRSRSPTHSTR